MRRKFGPLLSTIVAFLVLALFLGVSSSAIQAASKLRIVATTSMIADTLSRIGGDRVEVTALMGPGVDPHAYRQTRTDIVKLLRADLVFWHGLYLEAQMEEFFFDLAGKKKIKALGEVVPKDLLLSHDQYNNRFDPHIWMNPGLWTRVALAARDALAEADPDGRASYEKNTTELLGEIDRLIDYSKKILASVPAGQRVLLTAHDAFNYFGRAYGFEVLGIQGISTESEAGLRRIEDLVDTLVKRKISAVFVESSVADRNIKAVIEGAAAKGHKVIIGGELFSDAMGMPGTYEGTYIGMIDHNVTTITRALGGDAPARGMNERLAAGS